MARMRLQKLLAAAGVCSRRAGERHILAGDVRVNGQVVTVLGTQVDSIDDRIEFRGEKVTPQSQFIHIALNKPVGYVTSCKQPQERIVTSLVDVPERIVPIGRLDKESDGLLLLTNDGNLHHRLTHPSFDHEKIYRIAVSRAVVRDDLKRLSRGIVLNGVRTRPAKVKRTAKKEIEIAIREGRNRQIRRMLGKLGYSVVRLQRIGMANIWLGRLAPGQWRHLSDEEKTGLLQL